MSGQRRAEPGELCTCGRQAVVVFASDRWGEVGWCGISDGGGVRPDPCPFCSRPRCRRERCPRYQLRPDAVVAVAAAEPAAGCAS